MHLWKFPTNIAQKPWLHFLTNFATKAQKAYPPNLAKPDPTKINSFCNQTFDTSFWMHLWQFPTKIAQNSWLQFWTNFATKAQNLGQATKLGWAKTHPILIPFATKLLTPHFECICDNSPPRLHKTHEYTFEPILLQRHKNKAKRTNLAKPKPNQYHILLQLNFWHLILDAFVKIPHQDCSKTMTSLFNQVCYQATKSQSTQLG